MTDNEIRKALACCSSNDCEHCDYEIREDTKTLKCNDNLMRDALDLINRINAKIERKDKILDSYAFQYGTVTDRDAIIKATKAQAVKEFAERVKLEFYYEFEELIPSIMADKIDNLVKEMVGEQG